jgi:prophage antirepressor-like protein
METIRAFQSDLNITIKGTHEKPLFRASDVAAALDFDQTEKVVSKAYTLGGEQEVTFLTEKGLYQVLFTSRKPIAKQFKNWVCEVIEEIRLNGNYQLQQQLISKDKEIQNISTKNEEILLSNSSNKNLVYLGLAEDNIVKFGFSKGVEKRVLDCHKKEIGPQFVLKYTIHSDFYIELEDSIKTACKTKGHMLYGRKIKKTYNGKSQTELIQLDQTFTIEDLYNIVKNLNEKLINQKTYGNVIDEFKDEIKFLLNKIEILENENKELSSENKILKNELRKYGNVRSINELIPTNLEGIKKYFLMFLEYFIKDKKEGTVIRVSHKEIYITYVEFIEESYDKKNIMTFQNFGINMLKCPNITPIRLTLDKNDTNYVIGGGGINRIKGKQIIIDIELKKWISNEYHSAQNTPTKEEEEVKEHIKEIVTTIPKQTRNIL